MRCRPEIVVPALATVIAVVACSTSSSTDTDAAPAPADGGDFAVQDSGSAEGRPCPDASPLTYENFGGPFFLDFCTSCHSSALPEGARRGAPVGVDFDALEGIRARATVIYSRAADDHTTMPPAGGPSAEQRHLLGDWLACGAPGKGVLFDRGGGVGMPRPDISGACGKSHAPLPAAMLPRCAAKSRACLTACNGNPDDQCDDRCYAADPTPPSTALGFPIACQGCIEAQLLACGDAHGCHVPVAEFFCCLEQRCPPGSAADCAAVQCKPHIDAFGYCVYFSAPDCVDLTTGPYGAACFAPDVDAGLPPDAGPTDAGDGG